MKLIAEIDASEKNETLSRRRLYWGKEVLQEVIQQDESDDEE